MEVTNRKDLWTFAILTSLLQVGLLTVLYLLIAPPPLEPVFFPIVSLLGLVISLPVTFLIGRRMHVVWQAKQMALERAGRDRLTQLANRDAFYERVADLNAAYGVSLMVDIDHFKSVNDTHGHMVGDDVIRHVAQRLRDNCREVDLICRFGGEEFVIFLHQVTRAQGHEIAERMRLAVEAEPVADDPVEVRVTISVGGSIKAVAQDIDLAIAAADDALYRAKRGGRNRVEIVELA